LKCEKFEEKKEEVHFVSNADPMDWRAGGMNFEGGADI